MVMVVAPALIAIATKALELFENKTLKGDSADLRDVLLRLPLTAVARGRYIARMDLHYFPMTLCSNCNNPFDGGFDPNYPGLCAVCAWKTWFNNSDPDGYWDKVECLECELGRDCEVHPENNES